MLRDKDIGTTVSWADSLPLIISDPRYHLLKTSKQKRTAFDEYQIERAAETKAALLKAETRARDLFFQPLTLHAHITPHTTWSQVSSQIRQEQGYKQLVSFYREEMKLSSDETADKIDEAFTQHTRNLYEAEQKRLDSLMQAALPTFKELLGDSPLSERSSFHEWAADRTVNQDPRFLAMPVDRRQLVFTQYCHHDLRFIDHQRHLNNNSTTAATDMLHSDLTNGLHPTSTPTTTAVTTSTTITPSMTNSVSSSLKRAADQQQDTDTVPTKKTKTYTMEEEEGEVDEE